MAIVWLLYVRENGSSDEIPVVNEGIIGISLGWRAPGRASATVPWRTTFTPASSSARTLFRW